MGRRQIFRAKSTVDKDSIPKQFTAEWKNIALGHPNINKLVQCENDECIRQFSQGYTSQSTEYGTENSQKIGLTTEFLDSVNVYTQTDRAIKYGIVIIIITFRLLLPIRSIEKLRIHPIQYALVAMAQGIFFVLLLSMSEYYAFAWAYFVACIACTWG